MSAKIRVTILDDHQSTIDGYLSRLGDTPEIDVVATIYFGEDLEPTLARVPTDVLLLDVGVPTSAENSNRYPILHLVPKLIRLYPSLKVLVISMYAEHGLIQKIIDAGAKGYILKDDRATILNLGTAIISVANGGIYLSEKASKLFLKSKGRQTDSILTPRQLEALSLCAAYPDILTEDLAQKMGVTSSTVRTLLSGVYDKLKVGNRAAAIAKAHDLGILTPETDHWSPT